MRAPELHSKAAIASTASGTLFCKEFADVKRCFTTLIGYSPLTHEIPAIIDEIRPALEARWPEYAKSRFAGWTRDQRIEWAKANAAELAEMVEVRRLENFP